MNNGSEIQRKVDAALASLDNIERAAPNPFFYTRLEARLEKNQVNVWERVSRAVTKPVVALASLAFLVLLNAAVVVQGMSDPDNTQEVADMTSTEDLRASITFYDIENNEP